jgi:acetoin utilization deacetylase AcuC-like enzyme
MGECPTSFLMVLVHVLVSESVEDALRFDQLDQFNHPRERRGLILDCLRAHAAAADIEIATIPNAGDEAFHEMFGKIHSPGLLELLRTGWSKWETLGEAGQVPSAKLGEGIVPINMPLPRVSTERPSQNVLGQMGYYCTDNCTPLFAALYPELCADASVLRFAKSHEKRSPMGAVYYCLLTHPGHHAAYDSFGGYCYVNHVVALASSSDPGTTAILDVDYHAGNGTISMCQQQDTTENGKVCVVSIHCDPDFDYPFHSGWADEQNIPLPPGTTWENGYEEALKEALRRIQAFQPKRLVVSLGLDTYRGDPCAIRRAGFNMEGEDYVKMGQLLAEMIDSSIPTYFIQEGGYRMDAVGKAACDVVVTYAKRRTAK